MKTDGKEKKKKERNGKPTCSLVWLSDKMEGRVCNRWVPHKKFFPPKSGRKEEGALKFWVKIDNYPSLIFSPNNPKPVVF